MPSKFRPAPLEDQYLEPTFPMQSQVPGVATLLGRTQIKGGFDKKQSGFDTKPQELTTPGAMRNLVTPAGQPYPWYPFTPMATPSPCARFNFKFSDIHQQLASSGCGVPTTVPTQQPMALQQQQQQEQQLDCPQPGLFKLSLQQALKASRGSGEKSDPDDDSSSQCSEDDGSNKEQQLATAATARPPPPGALHPSIGSEGHALGLCKRCCFFPRGRCVNGYDCGFCHYEHERRRRTKHRKGVNSLVPATLKADAVPNGIFRPPLVAEHLALMPSAGTVATAGFSAHPYPGAGNLAMMANSAAAQQQQQQPTAPQQVVAAYQFLPQPQPQQQAGMPMAQDQQQQLHQYQQEQQLKLSRPCPAVPPGNFPRPVPQPQQHQLAVPAGPIQPCVQQMQQQQQQLQMQMEMVQQQQQQMEMAQQQQLQMEMFQQQQQMEMVHQQQQQQQQCWQYMTPQQETGHGQQVVVLEPAFMPQQQGHETMPVAQATSYSEVPPPPSHAPNLMQQMFC